MLPIKKAYLALLMSQKYTRQLTLAQKSTLLSVLSLNMIAPLHLWAINVQYTEAEDPGAHIKTNNSPCASCAGT